MSKVMEGDGLREHGANVTTNLNARNWLRYLTFITVHLLIRSLLIRSLQY